MNITDAYLELESSSKTELAERYAPMVKRIAHHLLGRLPKTVLLEDLVQAGMIGLLEAANNYDDTRGASFETYASIRIRGMMLDEVRKNDWLPRSVYRNARRISEAVRRLEHTLGRDAREHEIAEALEMNLHEYQTMLRDTNSGQIFGFDDLGIRDDMLNEKLSGRVEDPLQGVERENFHDQLAEAIEGLPEREKLILSLYYDEELNLKEIGEIIAVSESRVCQIHTQAMLRLQVRISDWKDN